jgi:hypothetical protein
MYTDAYTVRLVADCIEGGGTPHADHEAGGRGFRCDAPEAAASKGRGQ